MKSLLLPGTPLPREPVFRDVYVDDFAVLAVVETSNRAFAEDRLRMNRADTTYAALEFPIKKPAGDGDFGGPFWSAHLNATLALTTYLGACLGVNRAQLKEAPRGLDFTLSFRRECLSFVSFVGAQSLLCRKPCKSSGALLDELVLVSVLAPLFSANLRAPPLSELFAFDASDARAGGCRAPVSEDQWRSLYDLSEERREHVRLDWGSQPPDPVFSDARAAAAWSALSLP